MTELIGPVVALAFLLGIFAFMFRGTRGRVGRPPDGFMTRQRSPTETPWVAAAMGGLAIGTALGAYLHADTSAAVVVGALVGLSLAIPVLRGVSSIVLNVIAFVLALMSAGLFIVGTATVDPLWPVYRVVVIVTVLAAFALGVLIPGHQSALRGQRGLELFGIVEVATFLAAPSGRDAMYLSGVTNITYLLFAIGVAAVIGWIASEYILGVLAIAVAVTVWFRESVYGDATAGWAAIVTAAAAVGVVFLLSRFIRA